MIPETKAKRTQLPPSELHTVTAQTAVRGSVNERALAKRPPKRKAALASAGGPAELAYSAKVSP
jgi:hypothetical protein